MQIMNNVHKTKSEFMICSPYSISHVISLIVRQGNITRSSTGSTSCHPVYGKGLEGLPCVNQNSEETPVA